MEEAQLKKACMEFKDVITDTGQGEVFEVQFNPTELTFSGSTGASDEKQSERCLNLRMRLYFDRSLDPEKSVQMDVEKFLNAAKDARRRRIVFQWHEISFDGLLTSVSAEYTMFREDGTPVRAIVDITIENRSDSIITDGWKEDYKKIFGI